MTETHPSGEAQRNSLVVSVRMNPGERELLEFVMRELHTTSKARALRMALIGYAAVVANMKRP